MRFEVPEYCQTCSNEIDSPAHIRKCEVNSLKLKIEGLLLQNAQYRKALDEIAFGQPRYVDGTAMSLEFCAERALLPLKPKAECGCVCHTPKYKNMGSCIACDAWHMVNEKRNSDTGKT